MPTSHLVRALVLQQIGRAVEAEAEFRTSLRLEPSDETWFDFGLFYMTQRRYAEAAELFPAVGGIVFASRMKCG